VTVRELDLEALRFDLPERRREHRPLAQRPCRDSPKGEAPDEQGRHEREPQRALLREDTGRLALDAANGLDRDDR